jgi:hypothetical protein
LLASDSAPVLQYGSAPSSDFLAKIEYYYYYLFTAIGFAPGGSGLYTTQLQQKTYNNNNKKTYNKNKYIP